MTGNYDFYVGIDWATEEHQVCVLRPDREVVSERVVRHDGSAIHAFLDWLDRLVDGAPERVAISIEIPRGAVVESLIERGFHVYAINPKQLDRFRDRHTVAGAKDDRRDAFVLADSLRTDLHLFRRLEVDQPAVIQMRELLRMDEDLGMDQNRLTNRIREQLQRYYPQLLACGGGTEEPWLWELFEAASTPQKGRRLTEKRVDAILKSHRIRRISAGDVVAHLRTTALHVAPGTVEASVQHITYAIERLRVVIRQRRDLARQLERLVTDFAEGQEREHRDVNVLLSLTGVGKKVAAAMLAEASTALAHRDYHAMRALSGIAPVTKASGKRTKRNATVQMRRACNARLRNALYHWARVSTQFDPSSREQYTDLRRRGHSHGRALRSVADRQLRIAMAMLREGTQYDPQRASSRAAA